MNKIRRSSMGGFTLIELLVVIAIIGILASITLVSVNSARSKGTNTRILAELGQLRTQLEQNYFNGSYNDLTGSAGHDATLTSGSAGEANLTTLLCDIGSLNGYPNTVTDDVELTCDGVPSLHSGVVIYSTRTGNPMADYGIYATSTPGGYTCIDSYGNIQSTTTASIPDYASIVSPTTALCQ